MTVRVAAPAKINLTLKVGRPRADGLHPLQSLVVFAEIDEWVEASAGAGLSLEIMGPFAADVPDTEDNLVLRAARALAAERDENGAGARLILHKTMPVASGIGGGSSDAAATLKALNQLWGAGFSPRNLSNIARPLGADVPVCVAASAALMTGVGVDFEEVSAPPLLGVLVNPRKALATADVYRQFDAMGLGSDFPPVVPLHLHGLNDVVAMVAALGNDLYAPACVLMPEIAEIVETLRGDSRICIAGLSGSGATVFGLIENVAAQATVVHDLRAQQPLWWVQPVQFNLAT